MKALSPNYWTAREFPDVEEFVLKIGGVGPAKLDAEAQGQGLVERRAYRSLIKFGQGESHCQAEAEGKLFG